MKTFYIILSALLVLSHFQSIQLQSDPDKKQERRGRARDHSPRRGASHRAPHHSRGERAINRRQHRSNMRSTPSMSRTGRPRHARQQRVRERKQVRARLRQQARRQHGQKQFNRGDWRNWRHKHRQAAHNVRHRIRRHRDGHHRWFNDDFFARHHYRPFYHYNGASWWNAPRWNNIIYWLGWPVAAPIYYYQAGYRIPLVYEDIRDDDDDTIYVSEDSYIQNEWLPLGVFAIGETAEQAAFSNMFIQLTVNKNGEIAGIYYNATTDQVNALEGIIDRESQEVIWQIADNVNSATMVTGLYNLTQDVSDVTVEFPDGSEQIWFLVKLTDDM